MNHQLRKMEIPHNQTLHNQTTLNKHYHKNNNLENLMRILNSEKITLPSLRNIEWRTVNAVTNKVNQVLTYISTNNITELNELTYAGAKLVCEKIGILSKTTKEKSKPGLEFRLETQINKIYENMPK